MNRNLTDLDSLISVAPGEYVRCGSKGQSIKKITEPVQGLVIKKSKPQSYPDTCEVHKIVLVDGDLINVWCGDDGD